MGFRTQPHKSDSPDEAIQPEALPPTPRHLMTDSVLWETKFELPSFHNKQLTPFQFRSKVQATPNRL